jgi:hypothetical protein
MQTLITVFFAGGVVLFSKWLQMFQGKVSPPFACIILKMETIRSCETLRTTYKTTRRHTPRGPQLKRNRTVAISVIPIFYNVLPCTHQPKTFQSGECFTDFYEIRKGDNTRIPNTNCIKSETRCTWWYSPYKCVITVRI